VQNLGIVDLADRRQPEEATHALEKRLVGFWATYEAGVDTVCQAGARETEGERGERSK
jgi:hypothetical protein